ncbi:hypothetical protein [Ketogulonicigenium vulgare]|nr:hypothetical protein [Ketogulonicigenium vulgare]
MTFVLRALWALVTGIIYVLLGIGFVPREIASRLVPLQKFLINEIERAGR